MLKRKDRMCFNRVKTILIVLIVSAISAFPKDDDEAMYYDSLFKISDGLTYTDLDSAISNYNRCLIFYDNNHDTVMTLRTLNILVRRYSGKGNYERAYDLAWKGLSLVENGNQPDEKLELYMMLGTLYMVLEQHDKVVEYLERSESIIEEEVFEEADKNYWLARYSSLKARMVMRLEKNYTEAEEILKQRAGRVEKITRRGQFVNYHHLLVIELFVLMGRNNEALQLLHTIENNFEDDNLPIHGNIYQLYGQVYYNKGELDDAIKYFKKSMVAMKKFRHHDDAMVRILETLSACYKEKGNYQKALQYLVKAKDMNERLFGSRSSQNKRIFEIRDSYADQIAMHKADLQEQKLSLLEKDKDLWLYRTIAYFTIFTLITIGLLTLLRRQKRKFQMQQMTVRQERAYERQKQVEILEMKNRELTSAALKLLDRDNLLKEITKNLGSLSKEVQRLDGVKNTFRSINIDKSNSWKEFDVHFTAVNNDFYTSLKVKHPKLTPTDLKMCAFIKLGLSSKEMARIMGLGVNSVNTCRSRIRNKLGLNRENNLIEYLQKLSEEKLAPG